jgi:UDP-N-acetylglucosamine 2-epimerase
MDFDPFERYGGVGPKPDLSTGYLVVMQHPVTTEYEEARQQVEETLYAVKDLGMAVLWFWPNVDAGSDGTSKGIRVFREQEDPPNFHLFRNMFPEDFLRLLCGATAIVGNSSVAIRECSYLGVPAVNIGSRQSGRERGQNVIDVGHDRREIAAAICTHKKRGKSPRDLLYGDGKAGARIADCLSTAPLTIEKRLTY